jgi:hypothetical protein
MSKVQLLPNYELRELNASVSLRVPILRTNMLYTWGFSSTICNDLKGESSCQTHRWSDRQLSKCNLLITWAVILHRHNPSTSVNIDAKTGITESCSDSLIQIVDNVARHLLFRTIVNLCMGLVDEPQRLILGFMDRSQWEFCHFAHLVVVSGNMS